MLTFPQLVHLYSVGQMAPGPMARAAITGLETATIAVGVLLILLQYKINPALLVVGSAIVRIFSFAPK